MECFCVLAYLRTTARILLRTQLGNRELLEDVLGPIAIDYTRVNLVEQGFTFKRPSGAVCGCGASFDAWKSELTV